MISESEALSLSFEITFTPNPKGLNLDKYYFAFEPEREALNNFEP